VLSRKAVWSSRPDPGPGPVAAKVELTRLSFQSRAAKSAATVRASWLVQCAEGVRRVMNRPGFTEAWLLESGGVAGCLPSVGGLELRWREVADRFQQAPMVEPVNQFQGGVLDLVDALPRATPADQLGLVQPDDGLDQRVVERVAAGTDRRRRPGLGQPLGVADGQVLAAPVRVMYQAIQPVLPAPDAISGASNARSTRSSPGACQPTMNRENASMTKAT
jgi:hypothetical protein